MTSNPEVCNRIITTGLYGNMLENLKALKLNDPQWSVKTNFFLAQANILYNVIWNAEPARQASGKGIESQVSVLTYSYAKDRKFTMFSRTPPSYPIDTKFGLGRSPLAKFYVIVWQFRYITDKLYKKRNA